MRPRATNVQYLPSCSAPRPRCSSPPAARPAPPSQRNVVCTNAKSVPSRRAAEQPREDNEQKQQRGCLGCRGAFLDLVLVALRPRLRLSTANTENIQDVTLGHDTTPQLLNLWAGTFDVSPWPSTWSCAGLGFSLHVSPVRSRHAMQPGPRSVQVTPRRTSASQHKNALAIRVRRSNLCRFERHFCIRPDVSVL